MSDAPCAFKVGDKVVLPWLGPDQPEGAVACDFVKSARDYDPTAFWYYFRWPRKN